MLSSIRARESSQRLQQDQQANRSASNCEFSYFFFTIIIFLDQLVFFLGGVIGSVLV
jgi:hypothetical protein